MARTVVGLFRERASVEDAIQKLQELGYTADDLNIIAREGLEMQTLLEGEREFEAGEIAWDEEDPIGVRVGAVVGAATGLFVGVSPMAVPAIGMFAAVGPIEAMLTAGLSGLAGAMAAPLLDTLMGARSSEDRAEPKIEPGEILVSVEATTASVATIRQVLSNAGAKTVESLTLGEEPEKAADGFAEHSTMYGYSMGTAEYDVASEDRGDEGPFVRDESHPPHEREGPRDLV